MSFAIYCHVQGKYVKPNKTTKCQRPLETAVNEARKVFQDQFPTSQIPNTKCILKLFTYFLLNFKWYEKIFDNCQGILRHIGDYVAGDEKLYHYTGETGYIMKVPSKPAPIGLWIYQLVCELENRLPFLIHFRMMASQSSRSESAPVDEAVADWIRVVNNFPHKPALVVFDSYYFSTGSLSRLNSRE